MPADPEAPLVWQIGEVRVTRIVESLTTGIGRYVLPQATPEALADITWLPAPQFMASKTLTATSVMRKEGLD